MQLQTELYRFISVWMSRFWASCPVLCVFVIEILSLFHFSSCVSQLAFALFYYGSAVCVFRSYFSYLSLAILVLLRLLVKFPSVSPYVVSSSSCFPFYFAGLWFSLFTSLWDQVRVITHKFDTLDVEDATIFLYLCHQFIQWKHKNSRWRY